MDNNFKEIKFCNSYGYQIANKKIVSYILNRLKRYYKIDITKAYSKYFKMADTHSYKSLLREQHHVYYNFNEPLTLLYLTQYNGINFCYYIDPKKEQIISVKHRFSDELYLNDTLFEGKIIQDKENNWHFLISDLVIHQRHTYFTDLLTKLRTLNQLIADNYCADVVLDPCKVSVQDFVSYQYLESFLTDYRESLIYSNAITGVIFRPDLANSTSNIVFLFKKNFHQNLTIPTVKTTDDKTVELNVSCSAADTHRKNICFKLKKTNKPDIYELYLTNGKSDCYCDIANVPDIKTSNLVKSLFPAKYHYIYVNCKWDERFKRWTPYCRSERKNSDSIYLFVK